MVKSLLPASQLAAKVVTHSQAKENPSNLDNTTIVAFKKALEADTCTMKDGLAWVGDKLCVPAMERLETMQACHNSSLAGHFGFLKTLHFLKWQLWWPLLTKDVESYLASCLICAAAKCRQGNTPGLLQLVADPSASWR